MAVDTWIQLTDLGFESAPAICICCYYLAQTLKIMFSYSM